MIVRDALPDQPVESRLEAGTTHYWRFELEAGQTVTVTVDQLGIDLVLRLLSDAGDLLAEMDRPVGPWGAEELSWVAESTGTFRLEVAASDVGVAPGRYRMISTAPRQADDTDRRHAELLVELGQADGLRRNATGRDDLVRARRGYVTVLRGWQALDLGFWQLETYLRLGMTDSLLGDAAGERDAYIAGGELAAKLGDRHEEAFFENRLAGAALQRSDPVLAKPHLDRAAALAEGLDDGALQAFIDNNLGVWHYEQGDLDTALEIFLDLRRRWQALGYPVEAAWASMQIASLGLAQGQLAVAADGYEQAAEGLTAGANETRRLQVLISLAEVYLQQERPDAAADRLEAALVSHPEGHLDDRWLALLHNALGLAYARVAEQTPTERSRRALEHFDRARAHAANLTKVGLLSQIELNTGALLQRDGRAEEALEHFDRALVNFERFNDARHAAMAWLGLGLAYRDLGRTDDALQAMRRAVDLVETLRLQHAGLDARTWFLASKQRYFEELIDLLYECYRTENDAAYGTEALATVERRRARTFLDSLAEVELRTEVPPQLLDKERRVDSELRELAQALRDRDTAAAPDLARRQRQLLLERESIRTSIRRAHPQYGDLTRPEPLDIEQIQTEVLDAETHLLVYALGERRSLLFSLDAAGQLEIFPLASRARLATAVDEARAMIGTVAPDEATARRGALERLADHLLKPLYPRLEGQRLAIVPDGFVELVPFAALRIARSDDEGALRQYLVEGHESLFLPSASSLAALRRESPQRPRPSLDLALVADPVFSGGDERVRESHRSRTETAGSLAEGMRRAAAEVGLDALVRLPATGIEARAIADLMAENASSQLFLGFDARKDARLQQAVRQAAIVHIATHGIIDRRYPELSALALSQVDSDGSVWDDRFLYAYELYSQSIAAELVVLSACQTGVGPDIPGEGIHGLTRAFLYAGSPRVITSLWSVDDDSTAVLMRHFYHHLLTTQLPYTEALRQAQLSFLTPGDELAEPYYWAPFFLTGDWLSYAEAARGDGSIEQAAGGGATIPPPGDDPDYPIRADRPATVDRGRGDGGEAGS